MDHGIPRSWSDETLRLPEHVPELPDTSADTHTVDEPLHAGSPVFVGWSGPSLTQNLENVMGQDDAHDFGGDIPATQREPEIPADQPERDQEQPESIVLPEHEPKPVAAKANAKAKAKPLAGKAKANTRATPLAGKAKAKAKAEAVPVAAKAKAKAKAEAVPVAAKAQAKAKAEAVPVAAKARAKAKAKAKTRARASDSASAEAWDEHGTHEAEDGTHEAEGEHQQNDDPLVTPNRRVRSSPGSMGSASLTPCVEHVTIGAQNLAAINAKIATSPKCCSCRRDLDMLKCVYKGKLSPRFVCRVCNKTVVMLARNLQWPSLEFKKLSTDQQAEFFCKVQDQLPEGETRLRYMHVRGVLKDSLVRRRITEHHAKDGGKFQPLNFYEKQGYDIQAIEENTVAHDTEWHPVLKCMTYRLSIKEVVTVVIDQEVEEHIHELERKVQMKKSKRDCEDEDEDDDSDDESASPKKRKKNSNGKDVGKSGKELEKERKDAAKAAERVVHAESKKKELEEKQALQAMSKHNTGVTTTATKAMVLINASLPAAQKLLTNSGLAVLPEMMVSKLRDACEALLKAQNACKIALAGARKAAEKSTRLESLNFTLADLSQDAKKSKDAKDSLEKMLMLMKP